MLNLLITLLLSPRYVEYCNKYNVWQAPVFIMKSKKHIFSVRNWPGSLVTCKTSISTDFVSCSWSSIDRRPQNRHVSHFMVQFRISRLHGFNILASQRNIRLLECFLCWCRRLFTSTVRLLLYTICSDDYCASRCSVLACTNSLRQWQRFISCDIKPHVNCNLSMRW